jgi:hypothetical protein
MCEVGCTIYVCESTIDDVRTTKSPNDAFLGTYSRRKATYDCIVVCGIGVYSKIGLNVEGNGQDRK